MKTHFKVVSESGDGMGWAARLVSEGYDVDFWVRNPIAKTCGDNIVNKVGDLEDLVVDADRQNDVFVFDSSSNGICADYLMSHGFAVIGGSILADRLERDRKYGYDVMQRSGIEIPETKSFTDFEKAVAFVEDNPDTRWVYKPSKQLGDLSPSHVSYDAEDLIEMLHNISNDVDIKQPQFELQAFEKGVAISTELWFQHGDFIAPLTNHTLERKELMNDDIGPSGGCSGNILWFCLGCLICEKTKKLIDWARIHRYHGMLDLNAIHTKSGRFYGLEFTPRFGYDASPTLFYGIVNTGTGEFLEQIARGHLGNIDLEEGFAGAVRVTIPPYPCEEHEANENVPIRGIDDKTLQRSTFLYNVKMDDDNNLCSAGAWGIICSFIGRGGTPARALSQPLKWCEQIRVKNKQYRTDLAKCFEQDLETLSEAGVEIANGVL